MARTNQNRSSYRRGNSDYQQKTRQSGGNTSSQGDYKKNNGSKSGEKNGVIWINGWNNSADRGFVKVSIFPYSGSHEVKSEAGKTHIVLMANIQYLNSGMTDHYPVTYCVETGYVLLKKHGWLLNPKKNQMTRFTGSK
jgi:hypothetical protein